MSNAAGQRLEPVDPAEPAGIGGWLILPIIFLVVLVIAGGFQMTAFTALREVTGGLPQWKIYLLSFLILLSVVLSVLCPVILLVMLFRTMRLFPRRFVQWAIAFVIFAVVNHFAVVVIFGPGYGISLAQRLSLDALLPLFASVVPVAALIPYMLQSRRVKNTFVN